MKTTIDKLTALLLKSSKEKKVRAKTVKRRNKTKPSQDIVIAGIRNAIHSSGCRRLTVAQLFNNFGYKRRGTANVNMINSLLASHELYCFPPLDLSLPWKSRIQIFNFPVECKGDLCKNERTLQTLMHDQDIFKKLEVDTIIKEFSPNRTKDRLDFFGKDGDKNVVIEVKNRDGGKTAVEQVLRYAGMLKQQFPKAPVRKILITGIQDPNTAKAILGMTQEERDNFEWYLYKYDGNTKGLSLEKVDYNHVFGFFGSIGNTVNLD